MAKEIIPEEKILLVESKIRTCTLMQEVLETYLLEETDLGMLKEYQDSVEEYKSIINAFEAFKRNMLE